MSKLFEDDYPPTVAQAFRVARINLASVPELGPVAAGLAEHEQAVQVDIKAVSDANDQALAQAGKVRYADAQLGRTVIEIAREKRATIKGAKPDQHPAFRALFTSAPSEAMAGPPSGAQDNFVAVVEAGLELPENAPLKASRGAELSARKAGLAAGVAVQSELATVLALAEAKLDRSVAAARVAFNEAQLDAASLLKDESLVASLFDFRKDPPKKPKKPDA